METKQYEAQFLTAHELAQWIGVSTRTIWNWRQRGLRCFQAGPRGNVRFRENDVLAFLAARNQQENEESGENFCSSDFFIFSQDQDQAENLNVLQSTGSKGFTSTCGLNVAARSSENTSRQMNPGQNGGYGKWALENNASRLDNAFEAQTVNGGEAWRA
ncbi:MAG: helix-turn-helix domain-containing protein [Phycisphaeraceae bacterium]|nr:helix-turn-helix domain-containing protein [Phycisphaeraceae bacterium]